MINLKNVCSIRVSLTLSCPMNLKLFPLDWQTCSLAMVSCKYLIISVFFIYYSSTLGFVVFSSFCDALLMMKKVFFFMSIVIRVAMASVLIFPSSFYSTRRSNFFYFNSTDGWTTDDLIFLWRAGDPVQVAKKLQLPRFALEKFITDSCNSKTNTGIYQQFISYRLINN